MKLPRVGAPSSSALRNAQDDDRRDERDAGMVERAISGQHAWQTTASSCGGDLQTSLQPLTEGCCLLKIFFAIGQCRTPSCQTKEQRQPACGNSSGGTPFSRGSWPRGLGGLFFVQKLKP